MYVEVVVVGSGGDISRPLRSQYLDDPEAGEGAEIVSGRHFIGCEQQCRRGGYRRNASVLASEGFYMHGGIR